MDEAHTGCTSLCVQRCYIHMCASLTLIMSALVLSSRLLRRREATCLVLVSGLTPALSARLHTQQDTQHTNLTTYTCGSILCIHIHIHQMCVWCVWVCAGGCAWVYVPRTV